MTVYAAPKPIRPPKVAKVKTPRTRVRRRNVKRYSANWIRAYGSKERCDFVQSLPCIVRGCPEVAENAHVETGGISRKADANKIAPICEHHHRVELHHWGPQTFEAEYRVDLHKAAAKTEELWQLHIKHRNAA